MDTIKSLTLGAMEDLSVSLYENNNKIDVAKNKNYKKAITTLKLE